MTGYRLYIPKRGHYESFRDELKKGSPEMDSERELLREFMENRNNEDEKAVNLRVKKLNSRYSTRISGFEQQEIVEFIVTSGFDKRLEEDGYGLVDELRYVRSNRPNNHGFIDHLSFATKYCHHCCPNKYPIYDSLNMRVMSIYFGYNDILKVGIYGSKEKRETRLRSYEDFVDCYKAFCEEFIDDDYDKSVMRRDDEGFYIDKYIQAIGGSPLRKFLP